MKYFKKSWANNDSDRFSCMVIALQLAKFLIIKSLKLGHRYLSYFYYLHASFCV